MTRTILNLIIIFCFTLSCNWVQKHWHSLHQHANNNRKPRFMDTLRSYEPASYKGKVPDLFYQYGGAFDFWHFPIVYPYYIGCIDVTEYGCIYSDNGKTKIDAGGGITPLTDHFDRFVFDRFHLVASRCKTPFDADTTKNSGTTKLPEQYFIFSFADSSTESVTGHTQLINKLKAIHFIGDTTFMTIDQYGSKLYAASLTRPAQNCHKLFVSFGHATR